MASRAERRRRAKAKTVSLARETALGAAAHPTALSGSGAPTAQIRVLRPKTEFARRDDGLARLRSKGRLKPVQFWAGCTYGVIERTAALPDGASIRSFLELRPRGGGAGGLPGMDLSGPEWIAECRWRLADAHEALHWHEETIWILGLICGRGMHPREISAVQAEALQIETVLTVGLDMLARRWRDQGFRGVGDWPDSTDVRRLAGIN